jgi:hypothetical protein
MVEADIAGDIDEKQNHDGSTQISWIYEIIGPRNVTNVLSPQKFYGLLRRSIKRATIDRRFMHIFWNH